jgi:hypothetical protein
MCWEAATFVYTISLFIINNSFINIKFIFIASCNSLSHLRIVSVAFLSDVSLNNGREDAPNVLSG